MDVDAVKEWPHVQVMFDACDSSSNASTTQSLNSGSVNTSSSSRSTRSQQMLNVTSIVPNDARNGGPSLPSSRPSSIEKYQESPMLISPPAEDPEHVDTAPHCTGCKSASPAVANCFSCSSLLCANCVIAHQLMVAFEGHHVTNLGQGKIETREISLLQGQSGSIDAVRRMVKEAKKKLNELRKTIKSVDYSSSRLSSQYDKAMGEVDETYNFYMSMLAERKLDVTKEIEKLYSTKQVALSVFGQKNSREHRQDRADGNFHRETSPVCKYQRCSALPEFTGIEDATPSFYIASAGPRQYRPVGVYFQFPSYSSRGEEPVRLHQEWVRERSRSRQATTYLETQHGTCCEPSPCSLAVELRHVGSVCHQVGFYIRAWN